jgi:phosphoribosyl 1,2-cyclic phosphodiesterase
MKAMMEKNYLKFWGTRGSCAVSGPEYVQSGGNTCCLELRYDETHIIFDAGTGIRPLGKTLVEQGQKLFYLFLGHTHWDHLIGFPFFEPIYHVGSIIEVYSPVSVGRNCRDLFADLLAQEFFPVRLDQVQAHIHYRTIHPKTPIQMGKISLDFHNTAHPGTTYCFKIKTPRQTIGYVTDNEMLYGYHGSIDEIPSEYLEPYLSLIQFLSSCDILIHEAQYTADEYTNKVGWGHSSVRNAAALLLHTKCPRWIITHHEPQHTDEAVALLTQYAQQLLKKAGSSCTVEAAHDGFVLPL